MVAEAGDYADGNSGEIRKNGGRILAAGKQAEGPNSTWKLTMPEDLGEESVMQKLLKQFDVILIEADGSKRLPLKVPSETEPVLVPQTGLIIACAGLTAAGNQFGDTWVSGFLPMEAGCTGMWMMRLARKIWH